MGQSQRGVIGVRRIMEAEVRPLIVVIPRFIQLEVPLDPSALRVAKAPKFE
jgi:hypothetical protein